jgi:putative two-component system response regulator
VIDRTERLIAESLDDSNSRANDDPDRSSALLDGDRKAAKRVLIVDDDAALRRLIRAVLHDQCLIEEADSGETAIERLLLFTPGLVLLDIFMEGIDGYETCRRIKTIFESSCPQVIMVSAKSSARERMLAFSAGADDYVAKPFDPQDLRARVQLHFQLQDATAKAAAIHREIDRRHYDLRRLVEKRTQEIIATQDIAVYTLAKLAESRDGETGAHLTRMRSYTQILAVELSRQGPYATQIDRQFLEDLYRSSLLHDIGKVGIPDEILLKRGRLTPEETATMQQHAVLGANILDEAVSMSSVGGFLSMAAVIARHHHERFDGTGYPAGLAGDAIPLPARIVSVADAYDAITSERPYKPAYSSDLARELIQADSGRHFDPVIVAAFLRRFKEIVRAQHGSDAGRDYPGTLYAQWEDLAMNSLARDQAYSSVATGTGATWLCGEQDDLRD